MINIEKLLGEYSKSIKIRHEGDFIFVTLPFYHIESDESIALRFSETEDGRPIVTDCGTTRDYLEVTDVDMKNYRKKLKAIKERFFIEEEDGVFFMTMPTDRLISVKNHLGYFIQALSLIANIDL